MTDQPTTDQATTDEPTTDQATTVEAIIEATTEQPMTERLLALQAVDTTADQLRHHRSHMPELTAANDARAARAEWQRRHDEIGRQLDGLTAEIESAERDAADIDRQRDRLNAQLRTVIAPREAEALQHEIKTLSDRRNELDDRELLALEQQAALDDERVSHVALEPESSAALEAGEAALAAAEADIDHQLASLDERRTALRAGLPPHLLARYDPLRAQLGVAVARLVGTRCDGCHLDLSAVEVDAVKAVGSGDLAECPQCG
ncbi:MAG: zinc ribbon domain-containing protein, partial [Ilumatobacteraceae bacterium]